MSTVRLTPALMLAAYRAGLFPMARNRDEPGLDWYDPPERGILPLDAVHLPRRLRRTVLSNRFAVTADRAFDAVLTACAAPAPGRTETWINGEIAAVFGALHRGGHAHSIECREGGENGELVGGLYGVAIGGAFFGESMFSCRPDASKVALMHLVARLRLGGYALLDTQFVTDHLAQFGATAIPRAAYQRRLAAAAAVRAAWHPVLSPDQLRDHLPLS
ncbi:MAG: leucyl/phenylalanyl-tRNA--protein transferase [Gluconacetobacter diazotrophicus]|nr:leucyl/phenylalanyl-tRNA--protein transferase [Gluconacetobacter diazotrophicus]